MNLSEYFAYNRCLFPLADNAITIRLILLNLQYINVHIKSYLVLLAFESVGCKYVNNRRFNNVLCQQ